jgi:hypothetical protein
VQTELEETDSNPPEVIQALGAKPTPQPESQERASGRRKKRGGSSWEALASMFGVEVPEKPEEVDTAESESILSDTVSGVEASDENLGDVPQEVGPESKSEWRQKTRRRDEKRESLSIFPEQPDDANPALEAMFGDVPRKSPDEWQSKRKVVDDVGWEEVELDVNAPVDEAEVEFSGSESLEELDEDDAFDEFSEVGGDEIADEEEPSRRRRRPRRRGSRESGRGERSRAAGYDSEIEEELSSKESEEDADEDFPWGELDSPEADEVGEFGEVERRSNRRRRRGRKRTEPDAELEIDSSGAADSYSSSRERRPSARGPDTGKREAEPPETRRGSRRRRSEVSPKEDWPQGDDSRRSQVAAKDSSEASEATPQHRNIPTWYEAIEAIIETNLEKHRKNESRGGSRGRSRGRR